MKRIKFFDYVMLGGVVSWFPGEQPRQNKFSVVSL